MASLHARRKLCDFAVKRVFSIGFLAGNFRFGLGWKFLEMNFGGKFLELNLAGKF